MGLRVMVDSAQVCSLWGRIATRGGAADLAVELYLQEFEVEQATRVGFARVVLIVDRVAAQDDGKEPDLTDIGVVSVDGYSVVEDDGEIEAIFRRSCYRTGDLVECFDDLVGVAVTRIAGAVGVGLARRPIVAILRHDTHVAVEPVFQPLRESVVIVLVRTRVEVDPATPTRTPA